MQFTTNEYEQLARAVLGRIDKLNALKEQTEDVVADRKSYENLLQKIVKFKKAGGPTHNNSSLSELYSVGPAKPLAYLTESQVTEEGSTVESMQTWAKNEGLSTQSFPQGTLGHTSETLYVYDPRSLQQFLQKHQKVLIEANWPLTPDEYVTKVATQSVDHGTELYKLIAWSFADDSNPNI